MNSISVVIKGKRIFSNITDTMNSGDMVALTGSSGCGKTTLLNCLGLIQPIESGSILINGKDTSKWNDKDKTKFGINMRHLFIKIMELSKMKL